MSSSPGLPGAGAGPPHCTTSRHPRYFPILKAASRLVEEGGSPSFEEMADFKSSSLFGPGGQLSVVAEPLSIEHGR